MNGTSTNITDWINEFPLSTTAEYNTYSSFLFQKPMFSVGFSKASPTSTLSVSKQRSSTSTSESSDRISSSSATVTATTVQSIPPHNGGNNSVTLSGKIPDKDISIVQEVMTNAVKNTSKGKICIHSHE